MRPVFSRLSSIEALSLPQSGVKNSLLPSFEIETVYVPVREFRGDFVLTRRLRGRHDGSVLLVIGDVSGKGTRTSLAVSRLVFAIDEMAEGIDGPGDLLEKLNRAMRDRLNGEMATCAVVQIHRTGECLLSSAGHPLPLVNGREVHLHTGLPLGLIANNSYAETAITIQQGECLVLYTNGVTEARNAKGELFGEDRLQEMFSNRLSLREITEQVKRFGQMDDLTVLAISPIVNVSGNTFRRALKAGGFIRAKSDTEKRSQVQVDSTCFGVNAIPGRVSFEDNAIFRCYTQLFSCLKEAFRVRLTVADLIDWNNHLGQRYLRGYSITPRIRYSGCPCVPQISTRLTEGSRSSRHWACSSL
jgi:hypothetical protein